MWLSTLLAETAVVCRFASVRIWRLEYLLLALLMLIAMPVFAQVPGGHTGPVRALVQQSDGRWTTGGFDAAILTWDFATGRPVDVRRGHIGAVDALVALPDGCLVSGGEEGRLGVWCGTAPGRFIEAHAGRISGLARARNGRVVASASFDHTVKLWARSDDGALVLSRLVTTHTAPVAAVTIREDGAIASGSLDGEVRLTRPDGRMASRTFPAAVTVVASAGDAIVVGLGDGRVQVLSADLQARAESELIDGPPTAIAITANGRTAIVASARTPVTVVDLTGQVPARPYAGPGGAVWALALSLDEQQAITTGADGVLRQWRLDGAPPRGVAVAPTAVLAAAQDDGAPPVFRACRACHTIRPEDAPRAGPTLSGIMGRRIGTAHGYRYSAALTALDIVWTPETIARLFEVGPATYLPGTTMPEQRITDPEDRRALVEWLARATQ